MSKELKDMKPGEIVQAIRHRDLTMIKKLVRYGLDNKIWTTSQVAEMLEVDISTVSKWMAAYAK